MPKLPEATIQPSDRFAIWSLPVPSTKRWVIRRKAEVVAAVSGGLLTSDEACQLYSLSPEEFTGWQEAFDRAGTPGLRVTRIRQYRQAASCSDARPGLDEPAEVS